MKEKTLFTAEELQLMKERDFFLIKKSIIEKLQQELGKLNELITDAKESFSGILPDEVIDTAGKISKGENYRGFPWMVLDNPRVFRKEDVFAFRSMFWWGNEISFTLHLSGKYQHMIHNTEQKLHVLQNSNVFLNVNSTPWEYHFESGNYQPLENVLKSEYIISEKDFIKISRKFSLEQIDTIPENGITFYRELMKLLFDQRLPKS